jgi:pimeloyl-ACP methyl ester carboxylesterase
VIAIDPRSQGKSQEKYRELQKEFTVNYTIIPGSGHTVFVDKPSEFNKVVQQFTQ